MLFHSNTTNVKVKQVSPAQLQILLPNSNTTNVKVKRVRGATPRKDSI